MTLPQRSPSSTPEAPPPELEESYRRLLKVLRAGRDMFTLLPVESDLPREGRDRIFERLKQDLARSGQRLRKVQLTYQDWDPVEALEEELDRAEEGNSLVLVLCGLERTPPGLVTGEGISRPPAFSRLNLARELLQERHPAPLVVWCDPHTYSTLRRHAPDFFDHFTGLVRFSAPESSGEPAARELTLLSGADQEIEPRGGTPSASAVRFYERQLESGSLTREERVRALLGLAEALVDRRKIEGIAALQRGAEAAEKAKELLKSTEDLESWARAHFLIALSRYELGSIEIAEAASSEAVDSYRKLARRRPDAFRPDLARSLNNLSVHLADLGRREDALQAIQEAVDIRRELARRRPDAFRPDLASSLNNLSVHLTYLGRREDALQAIQEAVDIYRELARRRPDAFRPDLARSLNNLSVHLADLGRREDALQAIQEAVETYRELARRRPDAFRPDLARSLDVLQLRLRETKQEQEALAAIREALDLLEPYFRDLPAAHAPLMRSILRDYEQTAQACGVQPDGERLRSIRALLETVEG